MADEAPTARLRAMFTKAAADEMMFASRIQADADDLMFDYDGA